MLVNIIDTNYDSVNCRNDCVRILTNDNDFTIYDIHSGGELTQEKLDHIAQCDYVQVCDSTDGRMSELAHIIYMKILSMVDESIDFDEFMKNSDMEYGMRLYNE